MELDRARVRVGAVLGNDEVAALNDDALRLPDLAIVRLKEYVRFGKGLRYAGGTVGVGPTVGGAGAGVAVAN